MDSMQYDHHDTFFCGYIENRFSAIVAAAMLWQDRAKFSMITSLGSNPSSYIASSQVKEFAEAVFEPLVDLRLNATLENIRYDQSLILNRRLQKDVSSYAVLVRKYKAYFDRLKPINAQNSNSKILCSFSSSKTLTVKLRKYLPNVIQITNDMKFNKQAHLMKECDILVTQNTIDVASLFFLQPKAIVIGLNAKADWSKDLISLWNLNVLSQKLNAGSVKSWASLVSLVGILKTRAENKYLIFMPWEQLNNQIIGFKAACAMANTLGRIMVLPYLGYRIKSDWNFSFSPMDYSWSPMENYFDFYNLPCQIISLSNFKNLVGKRINAVHFNPVAKATSFQQIRDYYKDILGLHFTSITNHSKMSQLSKDEILEMFDKDKSKVLAFGALFWAFGFDRIQDYPLKKYITYMDNNLYRQITKGIMTKRHILTLSSKFIKNRIGSKSLLSVHIRRGDYWNKCKAISDLVLQAHCFPSVSDIKKTIKSILKSKSLSSVDESGHDTYKSAWDQELSYVYISTNLDHDRTELEELVKEFNILFFEDIFNLKEIQSQKLDPIHLALLDKELGINSDLFIGNFYSSFSRSIFEGRELLNKTFETF